MRVWTGLAAITLLLAGCAGDPSPVAATDMTTDSDGDGVIDALEVAYGTDPFNATSYPAATDFMVHEEISFSDSGMIAGAIENVAAGGCGGPSPMGAAVFTWTIDAPAGNVSDVHVTDLVFTATYTATMPAGDIYVFSPDGTQLTDSTPDNIPPSGTAPTDTVTVDGKHAPGDYRIEVRGCAGAGEIRLDATGILGWTPDTETLLHANDAEHEHGADQ